MAFDSLDKCYTKYSFQSYFFIYWFVEETLLLILLRKSKCGCLEHYKQTRIKARVKNLSDLIKCLAQHSLLLHEILMAFAVIDNYYTKYCFQCAFIYWFVNKTLLLILLRRSNHNYVHASEEPEWSNNMFSMAFTIIA